MRSAFARLLVLVSAVSALSCGEEPPLDEFDAGVELGRTEQALATVGMACQRDRECAPSLICAAGYGSRFGLTTPGACVAASCVDRVQGEGETEVDCGGACGNCGAACTTSCALGERVTPPALERLSFARGTFSRASPATYQRTA